MIKLLKSVRHFVHNCYDFGLSAINTAYYWMTPKNRKLVVNGFFKKILGHISKNNLGDDLNFYILNKITAKKIFSAQHLLIKTENILFIGSILQKYITPKSIVWGAGTISGNQIPERKPKEIRAVRGPLTRNWLLKNGIKCPRVYGDPGLLLPLVYRSTSNKKYKYGVIPHYVDWNLENIQYLIKILDGNYTLINMFDYPSVELLVDSINQCEFIISSSLHGLIISDAYRIPNIWVEFSNNVAGDGFKFQDYFHSVNRIVDKALRINPNIVIGDISTVFSMYRIPQIDIVPLLENAPFNVNQELLKNAKDYYDVSK